MALSSETRRSPRYIGTGSETIFPFAFKLLKPTDLEVRVALSGQVETTLEESAYTVVLNESQDNNPGGTVTLKAPLAKDAALVIISDTPYLQPTTYTNRGGFYPEQLNTNLDRLTILTQQLKEHLSRTLTFPVTSDTDAEQLVSDLLSAGIAARKVIPYLDDIRGVAGITDEVESLFESLQKLVAIADNIDALIRVEGIIEDIQQIADNVVLAQEAADAAQFAAEQIESKLADVEGVFEENKVLIQLTDTYLLTVLNTAATASWNFTARDIEAYWKWYQDGLDKLQQVATIALHTAEATENDIEHFVAWFTKAEEDETRLLKLLSQTAERSRQLVEMHISTYDDDIRTRNILIRTYVEKPYVLFIVAGQSNAVGFAKDLYEKAHYAGTFWQWYDEETPSLQPLQDPTAYKQNGSAWPEFGRTFFELTGRKVCVINTAYGGSGVTTANGNNWTASGSLRYTARTQYQNLKSYLETNNIDYVLGGVIWIQGEAETLRIPEGRITVEDYITGTKDIFTFFRTMSENENLPIFMSQIGYYRQAFSDPEIMQATLEVQEAQLQITKEMSNVYMAFEGAKHFEDAGYMSDSVHYSQKGYNIIGKAFARCIANTQTF